MESAETLQALLKLGAHNSIKDKNRAKIIYKRCIDEYPNDFRAYFNLGNIFCADDQDLEQALKHYIRSAELSPKTIEIYGVISGLLIKLMHPEAAARTCYQGLLIEPMDRACLYNLNIALRQIGQMELALRYTWDVLKRVQMKNKETQTLNPEVGWYRNILDKCHDDASGIDSDIRCRPFPADDSRIKMWSGWWLKCSLWAPTVEEELRQARLSAQSTTGGIDDQGGWVVYLDLDTVITGSMNIFNWKSTCHTSPATFDKHFMYLLSTDGMVNEHRSFGINSSVMIWYNNKSRSTSKDIEHYASASTSKKENYLDNEERFAFLYRYLIENYKDVLQCIYKFDHYLEMMLLHRSHDTKRMHGENEKICKFIQNEFPYAVADFLTLEPALCHHSNRDADHPMPARETSASQITSSALEAKGVALVCFPLLPKPLEVRDYCPWVAEYFATKLETRREGAL